MKKRQLYVFLFAIVFAAVLVLPVSAAVDLDHPAYVTDDANVLSADTEALIINTNQMLEQNCQGSQFCVVTVKYAPAGMDHEEYAVQIFDTWNIGASGDDNGALLVIYTEDDDFWLEMGAGAWNSPYIDEVADMVSDDSQFYKNILRDNDDAAVSALTEDLGAWYEAYYGTSSYNYTPGYTPAQSGYVPTESGGDNSTLGLIIVILLVVICTSPRRCKRRWGHWGLWPFFYLSSWWPTRTRIPRSSGAYWTTSYPTSRPGYRGSSNHSSSYSSRPSSYSSHSSSYSGGSSFHGGGGHSGGGFGGGSRSSGGSSFRGGGGHSGGGFGHR